MLHRQRRGSARVQLSSLGPFLDVPIHDGGIALDAGSLGLLLAEVSDTGYWEKERWTDGCQLWARAARGGPWDRCDDDGAVDVDGTNHARRRVSFARLSIACLSPLAIPSSTPGASNLPGGLTIGHQCLTYLNVGRADIVSWTAAATGLWESKA